MRLAPCIAAIALSATTGLAAAQDMIKLVPSQVGEIFCIARVGNDMAPVMALLTPQLDAAVAEAETKNAAWETANPGDKPPLGDGIPWQTAPDYAAVCTVGQVTFMMDEADVKIEYGFPKYPAANFADTLRLRRVDDPVMGGKMWRIDDVAYAGDGDLKTTLLSIFMD